MQEMNKPHALPSKKPPTSHPAPVALWILTSSPCCHPARHTHICGSPPLSDFPGPSARARTLFDCATAFGHLSKSLLGVCLMCARRRQSICAPHRLSRLTHCLATPPASRQQDSQAFCNPATHWHHCQINRSLAPSPPQPGVVRHQPGHPRSLPLSPLALHTSAMSDNPSKQTVPLLEETNFPLWRPAMEARLCELGNILIVTGKCKKHPTTSHPLLPVGQPQHLLPPAVRQHCWHIDVTRNSNAA
jgi:hypothetical protein